MASIEVSFLNRFEGFFNNVGDFFSFGPKGVNPKNIKSPQVKERGGNNFSLGDVTSVANSSTGRQATSWASQLLGGGKKSSGGISEACQNTPTAVYEACGCNPLHEAVGNFLDVLPLNETMKTAVTQCMSSTVNFNIASYDLVKGNLEGCVSRVTNLDPIQRDAALYLLTRYVEDAESRSEQWNVCQQGVLGMMTTPTSTTTRRQPVTTFPSFEQRGVQGCGPHPIDNAVDQVVLYNDDNLNKIVRPALSQCLKLNTHIDSTKLFINNLESCMSQTVDPETYEEIDGNMTGWGLFFNGAFTQEAFTQEIDEWNVCQQGALGVVNPQIVNNIWIVSSLPSPSSFPAISPLTIPQVYSTAQPTIPVFDHPVRLVLDDIVGKPFEFYRVYPNGEKVRYQLTVTEEDHSGYEPDRTYDYIVEVRWPGVTDYFDSYHFSLRFSIEDGWVQDKAEVLIDHSDQNTLILDDCSITMEVLPNKTKVLLFIPKSSSGLPSSIPQSLIEYLYKRK